MPSISSGPADLCFLLLPDVRHLTIREAVPLRLPQQAVVTCVFEFGTQLDDLLHLIDEPWVNSRQLVDTADCPTSSQSFSDGKYALWGRSRNLLGESLVAQLRQLGFGRVRIESPVPVLETAQCLLERFGESAPNCHGLPHTLHRGAQYRARRREFGKVEPGDLDHRVVERRLE